MRYLWTHDPGPGQEKKRRGKKIGFFTKSLISLLLRPERQQKTGTISGVPNNGQWHFFRSEKDGENAERKKNGRLCNIEVWNDIPFRGVDCVWHRVRVDGATKGGRTTSTRILDSVFFFFSFWCGTAFYADFLLTYFFSLRLIWFNNWQFWANDKGQISGTYVWLRRSFFFLRREAGIRKIPEDC